ncbi:hypothetical protein ScPMuIL_018893 [Solemya velum]
MVLNLGRQGVAGWTGSNATRHQVVNPALVASKDINPGYIGYTIRESNRCQDKPAFVTVPTSRPLCSSTQSAPTICRGVGHYHQSPFQIPKQVLASPPHFPASAKQMRSARNPRNLYSTQFSESRFPPAASSPHVFGLVAIIECAVAEGWSQWSVWSPCSLLCGGGVAWQTRECDGGTMPCHDSQKRFKICNEKACSRDLPTACVDLPMDTVSGPYISVYNPKDECRVSCEDQISGSTFVVDLPNGHRCLGKSDSVCLNGTCLIVGCDGIIGSTARTDGCGVCGGNNSCRLLHESSQFEWRVRWSPCSTSCGTGYQKTLIDCVDITSGVVAMGTKCSHSSKPESAVLDCSLVQCTTKDWDSAGYQSDDSLVGRRLDTFDVVSSVLISEEDLGVPRWRIGNYSVCSAECGGGVQWRSVQCVQGVSADVYTPAPSYRCPDPIPISERACNVHFCAAVWRVGRWSQCSVSCGLGIEMRPVFCEKTSISGFKINVSGTECISSKPAAYRQCQIGECYANLADMPSIKMENSTFIQIKRLKKVILNIGEKAILLAGQSVKIKCPVKNFNRRLLFWTKNRRLIPVLGRVRMTLSGVLIIKNADPVEDAGTYTCIAETLSAHVEVVFHSKKEAKKQASDIIRHIYSEDEENLINKPQADKLPEDTLFVKPPPYNSIVNRYSNRMTFTAGSWSPCSRTCGYGIQRRDATCNYVTKKYIKILPEKECLERLAVKPQTIRKCSISKDCPKWITGGWTHCSADRCEREHVGTQTRSVKCAVANSNTTRGLVCDAGKMPQSERECPNRKCVSVWQTSQWSECRPRCGEKSRKSRILKCVWSANKKPAYSNCKTKPRPSVWKSCKHQKCSDDCSDASRYCAIVGQLRMCQYRKFRFRCCATCKKDTL